MTSSLERGRPRRVPAHLRVRVARAVVGAVAGGGWLLLPVTTTGAQDPVPAGWAAPRAAAVARGADETSTADLVLPLLAVGAAGALAGYGHLRRTRRARTRTTPGVVPPAPPVPTVAQSERQARAALVLADDCVRTGHEELALVAARSGERESEPYVRALRAAGTELAAAWAIWGRYEEGVPGDPAARRQALVGVLGRCAEAGRLLDAQAPGLDRLRGLDRGVGRALEVAEGRFRELTARTAAAEVTVAELAARYAAPVGAPVAGYVEQAKDRLLFATARLNETRQAADAGDGLRAARQLRAAEGAVVQAGVLVGAVERLAAELREAAALVPAALTGAEAALAAARRRGAPAAAAHADAVLAGVRGELTAGRYDPLDALRRITRAVARPAAGYPGVLSAAARLVARGTVRAADDHLGVHRAAVGARARSRLAQALRALGTDDHEADERAREARQSAERDVREWVNPGPEGPGVALGGFLLGEDPDGGPPASFGGPATRGRHRLPRP